MDYRGMIREAVRTGKPVSAIIPINSNVDNKDIIDVEVIEDNISTQYALPCIIENNNAVDIKPAQEEASHLPSLQNNEVAGNTCSDNIIHFKGISNPEKQYVGTARKIIEILKKLRKLARPDEIKLKAYSLFFTGIVNYNLRFLTREERFWTILRAFGASDADIQYWQKCNTDESLIKVLARVCNETQIVMALAICEVLNMVCANCFKRFPSSHQFIVKTVYGTKIYCDFPEIMHVNGVEFKIIDIDVLYNYRRDIVQYVIVYGSTIGNVITFASDVQDEKKTNRFRIGYTTPDALLPSHELMEENAVATIILCLDAFVTIKLRRIARAYSLLECCEVIITGIYGGNDEVVALDFSPLAFRNVVIVASPMQECWDILDSVVKACKDNHASSINIYAWPVLSRVNTANKNHISDNVKNQLEMHITYIEDEKQPSVLVEKIIDGAINIKDLNKWKCNIGLNSEEKVKEKVTCEIVQSGCIKLKDMPRVPIKKRGDPVRTREFFNPNDITLIWAPSESGKSYFAQILAISLASGIRFFFLEADKSCKVLYIDGEIGETFRTRSDQLVQDNPIPDNLHEENIIVRYTRGKSIFSAEVQKDILETIEQEDVKILIIDNLNSNASEAVTGNPSKLFEFVSNIANKGLSITMVHHATKAGGTFSGRNELVTRSQNVIHLFNQDDIRDLANKDSAFHIPSEVKSMMQDKASVVIMLEITKCKVASYLKNKRYFFVLPFGGVWRMVDAESSTSIPSALASQEGTSEAQTPLDLPMVIQPASTQELPSGSGATGGLPTGATAMETPLSPLPSAEASPSSQDEATCKQNEDATHIGEDAVDEVSNGQETSLSEHASLEEDAIAMYSVIESTIPRSRVYLVSKLGWIGSESQVKSRSLKALKYLVNKGLVEETGKKKGRKYIRVQQ